MIAIEVHELAEHQRRLQRPDGYRPATCPRCQGVRLHLHDHLQRLVSEARKVSRIEIVRYICATDECRATWRVLPAFVARHLWRRWSTVARAISSQRRPSVDVVPSVAPRTLRRWNARLDSAARQLVLLLGQHDDDDVVRFARVAGFDGTRLELVQLLTAGRVLGVHGLEDIAAAVDRIERGVRLI